MKRLLSHSLLLALLLPQLLLLGMGKTLVICVASDGHMQLEVAKSDCCEAPLSGLMDAVEPGQLGDPDEPEGCDSCSDVAVSSGQAIAKKFVGFQVDLEPILPFDAWQTALQFCPLPGVLPPSRIDSPKLQNSSQLGCIVLRC